MRILVTGGAGYIGSVLVPYLLDKGHDVLILDSLIHEFNGLYGIKSPSLKVLNMGITTAARTQPWLYRDADVVVHLAALVGESFCNLHPQRALIINQTAVERILGECRGKFLFASTCSIYGRSDGLLTENSPINPTSLYADTKAVAEGYVLDYGGTVMRFATACGVSPRMRLDLMIPEFIIAALHYNHIEVYDSKAWRHFVHVLDIARAIEFLIHKDPGVWNVGGHNITKYNLAAAVAGRVGDVEIETAAKTDSRSYQVSFDKLTDAGFICSRAIFDAIRETYNLITAPGFDIAAKEWRNV